MELIRYLTVIIPPTAITAIWIFFVLKERREIIESKKHIFAWYTNPIIVVIMWFAWKIIVNILFTGNIYGNWKA